MKKVYLILLNYCFIIFLGVLDRFIVKIFSGYLGSLLFYGIPNAFNSEIPYAYNPSRAIFFIFHLSIIPFLLGFIKNKKVLFYLMIVYLIVEVVYIGFVSLIMGV